MRSAAHMSLIVHSIIYNTDRREIDMNLVLVSERKLDLIARDVNMEGLFT